MNVEQQLVNGIFIGSIYALFALGYTLVFGVLDVLNLAHASVFMLGAFFGLVAVTTLGVPLPVALLIAFIGAGLLGIVVDRLAFAPLRSRPDTHFSGLISSLALSIMFVALANGIFGPNVQRFPLGTFPEGAITLGASRVSYIQLVVIGVSVGLMVWLTWLVRRTRFGRALRTVAASPRAAALLGVNVELVTAQTFFLSSALGGVAGVLFGLAFNSIQTNMGFAVELKGLAVIIVGGMGSLPGAMIGGLVLGLSEVFAVALVGSTYRDAVAFALLFLILLVRPRGILGRPGMTRD